MGLMLLQIQKVEGWDSTSSAYTFMSIVRQLDNFSYVTNYSIYVDNRSAVLDLENWTNKQIEQLREG